jgi:hypothetical protein
MSLRPKYSLIKPSHILLLNKGGYLYSARMNSEILSEIKQFSLVRFEAMKKLCSHRTCYARHLISNHEDIRDLRENVGVFC